MTIPARVTELFNMNESVLEAGKKVILFINHEILL
jgi:hypothetical protein